MKKFFAIFFALLMLAQQAACSGGWEESSIVVETDSSQETEMISSELPVEINQSPDKYTHYIKNYVGKNCASLGYTSLGGDRMDRYGSGLLELVFVSADGEYVDISSDDTLKEYCVAGQNLEPNTELKLVFDTDDEGNEYDSLVQSQSFEEIVLSVKKVGTQSDGVDLTVIKPAPDKYTRYIVDYVGRNLASCGYASLGGDRMARYGGAYVRLVIVTDDGSFVDPEDEEQLKNYVVTGQNVAPNTELKITFETDSEGNEYGFAETQSIEEIELYVKRLAGSRTETEQETEEAAEPEKDPSEADMVDGMRTKFKDAMDSYEKFMEEYVDFMKNYEESGGSDLTLLADYARLSSEYLEFCEEFERWEDEALNAAESAYYIEVQARVNKKLLELY